MTVTKTSSCQPIKRLYDCLSSLATLERYLFTPAGLRCLVSNISADAYRSLLSRVSKEGKLERICCGLYLYVPAKANLGDLLFHAAARLRADELNYISLETALSDVGVISQVPINRITVMSSGPSNRISCGRFGTIEFVRTKKKPAALAPELGYDQCCRLWRAKPALAL